MKSILHRRRGAMWSLSKIAILIGAVMLFAVLWNFYKGFHDIQSISKANGEARNLARIMEEVGSSPYSIDIIYKLPDDILGNDYNVSINQSSVRVILNGKFHKSVYVPFLVYEKIDNFSATQGAQLLIQKFNSSIKIDEK